MPVAGLVVRATARAAVEMGWQPGREALVVEDPDLGPGERAIEAHTVDELKAQALPARPTGVGDAVLLENGPVGRSLEQSAGEAEWRHARHEDEARRRPGLLLK